MIKLERTSVMNLENAIRGARNPMNSWGRMDSYYDEDGNFVLGENDLGLALFEDPFPQDLLGGYYLVQHFFVDGQLPDELHNEGHILLPRRPIGEI